MPSLVSRVLVSPFAEISAAWRGTGAVIGCGMLLLASLALLTGCHQESGTAPNVPTGMFDVQIDGTLDREVTGAARYRNSDGDLVGLELVVDSTSGMSIELEPGPVRRTSYQVVEWELLQIDRPGGAPGTIAFFEHPKGSFESVDGTVDVTYVADGEVGGTFDFEMTGSLNGVPGEPYSLTARGRWIATPLEND